MIITSKRKFYELWEAGVLGNRTAIYHTLDEALDSGSPQIGFREVGKTGGGAWTLIKKQEPGSQCAKSTCWYSYPGAPGCSCKKAFVDEVTATFNEWKRLGRTFIMDNSVPNNKSTMQGEICRTFRGLQSFLAVGTALPPMRITMAQGLHKHRNGAETNLLLDRYMDPSSRDDLRGLLDLYPDAAIEFTCFSVNVGHLPHRNTIFWETRNY